MILTALISNWRLLAMAAAAALIGFLLWRVDSLSASLEAEQTAHAAAVETANKNAVQAAKLAAEVTRMNAVLATREAELAASRRQITSTRKTVQEATHEGRDAPAAPLWGDVFDGLRQRP